MLKELGLVFPFSPEEAGLTEMVESHLGKDLYVSSIHHKALVEVNEEGTEAGPRVIQWIALHPDERDVGEDRRD